AAIAKCRSLASRVRSSLGALYRGQPSCAFHRVEAEPVELTPTARGLPETHTAECFRSVRPRFQPMSWRERRLRPKPLHYPSDDAKDKAALHATPTPADTREC